LPAVNSATRKGPFYEFKSGSGYAQQPGSGRLLVDGLPIGSSGVPLNFFVYLDPFNKRSPNYGEANGPGDPLWTNSYYKQPYAFFSSYKTTNGYNRYGISDCASLQYQQNASTNAPPTLQPYYQPGSATFGANPMPATAIYLNASSYQVICAGADGVFGIPPVSSTMTTTIGGSWNGTIGQGTANLDDWGNFSRTFLGAPQTN
jgi:hypothetical protein